MKAAGIADISVIMPSFDRTELSLETLQSVLDQSCPVREIIVVANGDDDHAAFWARQASARVKILRVPPLGQQDARNRGIEAAASAWVAMLDDDDLYSPDFIQSVLPAIEDGRADLVATDHRKFHPHRVDRKTNFEAAPRGYWDDVRLSEGKPDWTFVGKFPLPLLLKRIPIYPSTMVMRRDFALGIGGYCTDMLGIATEDIEFLIRALTYGNLSLVWRPLVQYRVHDAAYSGDAASRTIGRWRVFEYALAHHEHLPDDFRRALERDLPPRRRRIFRLATAQGDAKLADEAWRLLAPERRTPDILVRRLASKLFPAELAEAKSRT